MDSASTAFLYRSSPLANNRLLHHRLAALPLRNRNCTLIRRGRCIKFWVSIYREYICSFCSVYIAACARHLCVWAKVLMCVIQQWRAAENKLLRKPVALFDESEWVSAARAQRHQWMNGVLQQTLRALYESVACYSLTHTSRHGIWVNNKRTLERKTAIMIIWLCSLLWYMLQISRT